MNALSLIALVALAAEPGTARRTLTFPEVLVRMEQGGKGKTDIVPGGNIEHIQLNTTDPWTEIDGERAHVKTKHPTLTDPAVRQALVEQNADVPGGKLTNARQERAVRLPGRLKSAAEFEGIEVARVNNSTVRRRDVGRGEDGSEGYDRPHPQGRPGDDNHHRSAGAAQRGRPLNGRSASLALRRLRTRWGGAGYRPARQPRARAVLPRNERRAWSPTKHSDQPSRG
jgi:hypothetical protein